MRGCHALSLTNRWFENCLKVRTAALDHELIHLRVHSDYGDAGLEEEALEDESSACAEASAGSVLT